MPESGVAVLWMLNITAQTWAQEFRLEQHWPARPYPGLHEPCERFEIRGEKLVDQAGIEPATS